LSLVTLSPGRLNGILEDISAEIGFTATSALAAWFGGLNLYIPAEIKPGHPIAAVIGITAFRRLVQNFGTEILCMPEGRQDEIDRRDRIIAEMLGSKITAKTISEKTGITLRRVQQIRSKLEASGLIPLVGQRKLVPVDEVNEHIFGSPLTVVAAAVLNDGVVVSLPAPARHADLGAAGEHGFLLSDGRFATPAYAAQVALASGQISRLLVCEDVW
jgi:hypothetical protein